MAWTPLWEAEASPPWEVVVPSPPLAQAFLPWVLPLSSPPSTGMQCSLKKAFLSRETPGGAGQGQRYFGFVVIVQYCTALGVAMHCNAGEPGQLYGLSKQLVEQYHAINATCLAEMSNQHTGKKPFAKYCTWSIWLNLPYCLQACCPPHPQSQLLPLVQLPQCLLP